MVEVFLADESRSAKMIGEALKAGDSQEVASYDHKLKGSSRHVAARRLSEVAHSVERAAREDDMATAASLFGHLQTEFEAVTLFLHKSGWAAAIKQTPVDGA